MNNAKKLMLMNALNQNIKRVLEDDKVEPQEIISNTFRVLENYGEKQNEDEEITIRIEDESNEHKNNEIIRREREETELLKRKVNFLDRETGSLKRRKSSQNESKTNIMNKIKIFFDSIYNSDCIQGFLQQNSFFELVTYIFPCISSNCISSNTYISNCTKAKTEEEIGRYILYDEETKCKSTSRGVSEKKDIVNQEWIEMQEFMMV